MPARRPDPALPHDEVPTQPPAGSNDAAREARETGPAYRPRWQIPTDPPPV